MNERECRFIDVLAKVDEKYITESADLIDSAEKIGLEEIEIERVIKREKRSLKKEKRLSSDKKKSVFLPIAATAAAAVIMLGGMALLISNIRESGEPMRQYDSGITITLPANSTVTTAIFSMSSAEGEKTVTTASDTTVPPESSESTSTCETDENGNIITTATEESTTRAAETLPVSFGRITEITVSGERNAGDPAADTLPAVSIATDTTTAGTSSSPEIGAADDTAPAWESTSETDEEPQELPEPQTMPFESELTKTFEIYKKDTGTHQPNPGDSSVFGGIADFDANVYYLEEFGLDSRRITDRLNETERDSLAADLGKYCKDGDLDIVSLINSLPMMTIHYMFSDEPFSAYERYGSYMFRINDDWLVSVNKDERDVSLYKRQERYSEIERIAEALWTVYDRYPDMTVLAVQDWDKPESEAGSLEILTNDDDTLQSIRAYLTEQGFDMSLCSFMTYERERSSQTPVTVLHADGDSLYTDNLSIYAGKFDNKVYMSEFPLDMDSDMLIDKLNELGYTTAAGALSLLSASDGVFGAGELDKAFASPAVYGDLFDTVPLPVDKDAPQHVYGGGKYYRVPDSTDNVIIEAYYDDISHSQRYSLWSAANAVYLNDLDSAVKTVTFFRRYQVMNDSGNGFEYVIDSLEFINSSDSYTVRIIADMRYWENILNYANSEGIMTEILEFSEKPADIQSLSLPDDEE